MNKICEPIDLIAEFLPSGMDHAVKVAEYATTGSMLELASYLGLDVNLLHSAATLHDFVEDTGMFDRFEGISKEVWSIVEILTKKDDETYHEYLLRIKERFENSYFGKYAYIIKLADMKDHLSRKETLTDKLKEKYIDGLAVLL